MLTTALGDWIEAPLRLPRGWSEFVVGDVHGCREQLEAILDAGRSTAPDAHLTLLGDLADRGPDSLGAIRAASDALDEWRLRGLDATQLPGNHEQLLLGTVLDTRSHHASLLLRNGGEWLYDLCVQAGQGRFDPPTVRSRLQAALGKKAWAMLTQDGAMLGEGDRAPVLHRRVGNVILVHAGVHPLAEDPETWIETAGPLELDDEHHLWIREPFLAHPDAFGDGLFVVHGHTHEFGTKRHDGSRAAPGEHRGRHRHGSPAWPCRRAGRTDDPLPACGPGRCGSRPDSPSSARCRSRRLLASSAGPGRSGRRRCPGPR